MKHLVVLFLISCVFFTADAQQWSIGARWIYLQDDYIPNNIDEYRVFTIEKDTVIQNLLCSKVIEKYVQVNGGILSEFFSKKFFLHQNGPKVFLVTPDLIPLYDFSKTTGDTLLTYCADGSEMVKLRIDSVTVTTVGSEPLHVQWVSPIGAGSCFMNGPIFEHIGNNTYFFARPGFVDPPPGGLLYCFSDSILTYQPGFNCEITVNNTEAYSPDPLRIFPNPTSGKVFLENEKTDSIRVLNLWGQVLKTEKAKTEIWLNEFPDGVYLLEIQTPKGVFVKKIIKKT